VTAEHGGNIAASSVTNAGAVSIIDGRLTFSGSGAYTQVFLGSSTAIFQEVDRRGSRFEHPEFAIRSRPASLLSKRMNSWLARDLQAMANCQGIEAKASKYKSL
jgi:hypothetical protein